MEDYLQREAEISGKKVHGNACALNMCACGGSHVRTRECCADVSAYVRDRKEWREGGSVAGGATTNAGEGTRGALRDAELYSDGDQYTESTKRSCPGLSNEHVLHRERKAGGGGGG